MKTWKPEEIELLTTVKPRRKPPKLFSEGPYWCVVLYEREAAKGASDVPYITIGFGDGDHAHTAPKLFYKREEAVKEVRRLKTNEEAMADHRIVRVRIVEDRKKTSGKK
jgi:hypothetical protein